MFPIPNDKFPFKAAPVLANCSSSKDTSVPSPWMTNVFFSFKAILLALLEPSKRVKPTRRPKILRYYLLNLLLIDFLTSVKSYKGFFSSVTTLASFTDSTFSITTLTSLRSLEFLLDLFQFLYTNYQEPYFYEPQFQYQTSLQFLLQNHAKYQHIGPLSLR